jgi:hypothetical protein
LRDWEIFPLQQIFASDNWFQFWFLWFSFPLAFYLAKKVKESPSSLSQIIFLCWVSPVCTFSWGFVICSHPFWVLSHWKSAVCEKTLNGLQRNYRQNKSRLRKSSFFSKKFLIPNFALLLLMKMELYFPSFFVILPLCILVYI